MAKITGKGGKVINVASIGGQIIFPNMSAYCASKGGVLQLTKVMALEWIRYNIQVNAILPGYFETPMNTHFFATPAGQKIIRKNKNTSTAFKGKDIIPDGGFFSEEI